MSSAVFQVVYRGRIRDGFEFETALRNVVRLFKLRPEQAQKLLKTRRAVLKQQLDRATADKIGAALKRAGLDVAVAPMPDPTGSPPDTPTPPPLQGAPAGGDAETPDVVPKPTRLEFRGNGSEYFRIWIVNIILSIITLGIYSAWAKVRRKQYFYGNTRIDSASFEYLADPMKILKGRAIVFVVFVAYSILQEVLPLVGMVLSLLFLFILPWLVVRSLTFNARNSAIRNIRFNFSGTYRQAAGAYVLWPILAVLTLGLLTPYVFYRQKKFMVDHSAYGTTGFRFTATSRDYYRVFLMASGIIIVTLILAVGLGMAFPAAAVLPVIVAYLYLFAYFSVKMTNLLVNASRLGDHRFRADLAVKPYAMILLVNSILTALTLGLYHPWAKVRAYRYKIEHLTLVPGGSLDAFVAAEEQAVSSIGEEASDFFDFDIGL